MAHEEEPRPQRVHNHYETGLEIFSAGINLCKAMPEETWGLLRPYVEQYRARISETSKQPRMCLPKTTLEIQNLFAVPPQLIKSHRVTRTEMIREPFARGFSDCSKEKQRPALGNGGRRKTVVLWTELPTDDGMSQTRMNLAYSLRAVFHDEHGFAAVSRDYDFDDDHADDDPPGDGEQLHLQHQLEVLKQEMTGNTRGDAMVDYDAGHQSYQHCLKRGERPLHLKPQVSASKHEMTDHVRGKAKSNYYAGPEPNQYRFKPRGRPSHGNTRDKAKIDYYAGTEPNQHRFQLSERLLHDNARSQAMTHHYAATEPNKHRFKIEQRPLHNSQNRRTWQCSSLYTTSE